MCKVPFTWNLSLFRLQSSHLNICYYHQDLHRRPLRPGSRPGFCSDRRALLLIGLGPCPDGRNSPAGSSYPEGNFGGNQLLDGSISLSPLYPSQTNDLHVSIAAGLHQSFSGFAPLRHSSPSSGPDRVGRRCNPQGDPTNQLPCALRVTRPLTRTHVRLLGPCFKTGRMGSPQADARSAQVPRHAKARAAIHNRDDDVSTSISTAGLGPPSQSASVNVPSRSADRLSPFHIRRDTSPAPIRFPPDNFKHL
ncbi:hypothetical protein JHK84_035400 [Glycine max]|nr:hypothetical protein JHK84_035400 [Glycine max]